jgi:acetyl esterase/lipase
MEPQNQMQDMQVKKPWNKKFIIAVSVIALLVIAVLLLSQSRNVQKFVKHTFDSKKGEDLINDKDNELKDGIQNSDTQTVDESEGQSGTNSQSSQSEAGELTKTEEFTVVTKKDVVYGTASGINLKIDIYTPVEVDSPTPAVLYIHGGGFKGGSKNGVADDALMLAKHGTAVVAIDYRLSGTAIFPAQIHDVKGVARYVRAHADEYNIDSNAIFSLGESAGGVLASLLGVTEGNTTLEGTIGGNNSYSSDVAGVINISGSYVASIVDSMGSGIKNAISAETGCSPVPSTACKSTYEALSPETYLTSNDSPFIILHGSKDQSVPQIQAETLDSKLSALGVPSEIYIASDLAHVGGLLSRYLDEVIDFINTNS